MVCVAKTRKKERRGKKKKPRGCTGRPTRLRKQTEGCDPAVSLSRALRCYQLLLFGGAAARGSRRSLHCTVGADGSESGASEQLCSAPSDSQPACRPPLRRFPPCGTRVRLGARQPAPAAAARRLRPRPAPRGAAQCRAPRRASRALSPRRRCAGHGRVLSRAVRRSAVAWGTRHR